MKIEICIGEDVQIRVPDGEDDNGNIWYVYDTDTVYEHEGYYDSIDEAIEALQYLKMCEKRGDFVE